MIFALCFGGSLAMREPCTLSLRLSGVRHAGSHLSSLIQVAEFNERPLIVPPEVLESLNVHTRALSPKINIALIYLEMLWIKWLLLGWNNERCLCRRRV